NITLPSTVFHGSSWSNSWNTIMRSEPGRSIDLPDSRIAPSTGAMKPATALSSVDLPQPDGPSSTKRSLANTSKPTRQVAVTRLSCVLYWSVTLSTASSGCPSKCLSPTPGIPVAMRFSPLLGPTMPNDDRDHRIVWPCVPGAAYDAPNHCSNVGSIETARP